MSSVWRPDFLCLLGCAADIQKHPQVLRAYLGDNGDAAGLSTQ